MAKRQDWKTNLLQLSDEGVPRKTALGYAEFAYISTKALADKIGVSPTTLRRWLKGEQSPSPTNQTRINRLAGARRAAMVKAGYPSLPRIPYGHRRQLKKYRATPSGPKWTGETYESPWINFHIEGFTMREMLDTIDAMRGHNNYIQLIYRIEQGPLAGSHAATKALPIDDDWPRKAVEEYIRQLQRSYESNEDEPDNQMIWLGVIGGRRYV